jgi:beta-galactosidase GanA
MKGEKMMIAGTQYYRPPTPPPEEHEGDLARIREMGFDSIRVWLSWGWHEVRKGEFIWDDMDRLFGIAQQNGLQVVINLQLEIPPAWFHPENILTGPAGVIRRSHFLGTRVPCFDATQNRLAAEPFIRAAGRHYSNHPALLAWDAWNEPHARDECLCAASRDSFTTWLKDTYGDVAAFNRLFGKRFTAFDEVPMAGYGNEYSEQLNYRLWAAHSVASRVRWAADRLRGEDPHHPITSHSMYCSVGQAMLDRTSVCALTAKTVDFYGLSMPLPYDNVAGSRSCRVPADQRYRAGLMLDWCRSISTKFWAAEIYSNPAGQYRDLNPADLSWQFWLSVAAGAKGVFFWQYKPERLSNESPGYGLVDLNGRDTERSLRIAGDLCVFRAHRELFNSLSPVTAHIGILYDERSHCVAEVDPELKGLYLKRIHECYRLMESSGLPVRFVPRQDMSGTNGLKILYLVGPCMMDAGLATVLHGFVSQGGTVIAEPGLGYRLDNTWTPSVVPPEGLDGVFGIREGSLMVRGEPFAITGVGSMPDGMFVTHQSHLDVISADVIAVFGDGSPAVTRQRCGKGYAIYLAGCIDASSVLFAKAVLESAGVRAPAVNRVESSAHPMVRLRMGVSGDHAVLFWFNSGTSSASVRLTAGDTETMRLITGGKREGDSLVLPADSVTIAVMPRTAINQ